MARNLKLGPRLGLLVAFVGLGCLAKEDSLMRGGDGFLFSDLANFENGAQWAGVKNTVVAGTYQQSSQVSYQRALTGSIGWGNGKLGLGGFYSFDAGGSETEYDSLGGCLGVVTGAISLGVMYRRYMTTSAYGEIAGTLLYRPGKNSLWVGIQGETGHGRPRNAHSGNFYLGKQFNTFWPEIGLILNDFNDLSDFGIEAAGTLMGQYFFLSAFFDYFNTTTRPHIVGGRIGVVAGQVDLSLIASKTLVTGSNDLQYGGQVRLAL